MAKYSFLILSFLLIFFSNIFIEDTDIDTKANSNLSDKKVKEKKIIADHSVIKDTLYTFKNYFIEIDLSKQMGYLHSRADTIWKFKISSGTDKLTDGVNTKEGVFVIQSKAASVNSKQFDDIELVNWLGFNLGIGFHALKTSGYYRYLGKKPSSHGCLRISREDSKILFKYAVISTPVLVHNGSTAITIGFADSSINYKKPSAQELFLEVKNRRDYLYYGMYLLYAKDKYLIDTPNIKHHGLSIGDAKQIALKQELIDPFVPATYTYQDYLKPKSISAQSVN